jgi:hypothetical protein
MLEIKDEILEYIDILPDNKLEELKPLLHKMYEDSISIEYLTFDQLEPDEQAAVIRGREADRLGLMEEFDIEELLK